MKKVFFTIAAVAASAVGYAGGIATNTNQHAAYQRNFAREASTEADAAYSNPAGLGFMEDGFYISFSAQTAFQERNIESSYPGFGKEPKKFEGKAVAPFVPSLQAVYKKKDWALSLNVAVSGGGGKATYDNGLPSFESQVSNIPLKLSAVAAQSPAMSMVASDKYSVECSMEGAQYIVGTTLGFSYKFTDFFSASAGARVSYALNRYEGYIRDIKINPQAAGGQMVAAPAFFSQMAETLNEQAAQAETAAKQYKDAGDETMSATYAAAAAQARGAAAEMENSAKAAGDKEVECKQTGVGVAPILGVDFKFWRLNVASRYEFATKIELENETEVDGTGMFPDGKKSRSDVPALWALGVNYNFVDNWTLCLGYRYYFDKDAELSNGAQDRIDHGTKEYAAAVEWNICKSFLVSASYLRTQYSLSDGYLTDLNFNQSNNNFGLGLRYTLNDHLNFDLAGFFTDYEDRTKKVEDYAGLGIGGSDTYSRSNFAFALGVNYKF